MVHPRSKLARGGRGRLRLAFTCSLLSKIERVPCLQAIHPFEVRPASSNVELPGRSRCDSLALQVARLRVPHLRDCAWLLQVRVPRCAYTGREGRQRDI
jgi:hypothetical protein